LRSTTIYINFLRSSSYNDWFACQLKYFLIYVLGFKDISNKSAEKGTICHKALECLANIKLSHDKGLNKFEDNEIGTLYVDDFLNTDENISDLVIKIFDYYTSPSKTIHTFNEADLKDCIKWTNIPLKYGNGMFDPRLRNIVEPELFFDIEFDKEWAKYDYNINNNKVRGNFSLKGTVDLVTKEDDKVYEVIDWKTGRRINWSTFESKTYDKLYFDPQLRIYHYALSKIMGNHTFIITIFYIKDGGPFSMVFNNGNIEQTKNMLKNVFLDIKNTTKPIRRKETVQNKRFCSFCTFNKQQYKDTGMSICDFIHNEFKSKSIDTICDKYCNGDFQLGNYERG